MPGHDEDQPRPELKALQGDSEQKPLDDHMAHLRREIKNGPSANTTNPDVLGDDVIDIGPKLEQRREERASAYIEKLMRDGADSYESEHGFMFDPDDDLPPAA